MGFGPWPFDVEQEGLKASAPHSVYYINGSEVSDGHLGRFNRTPQ